MPHQDKEKFISVEKTLTLDTIPSGSGMAFIKDSVYIIGDDSPWLFELSSDYKSINRYLLVSGFQEEGRIPKPIKPDFESMAEVKDGENTSLLIFGSGSKSPERDVLVKVDIQDLQNPQVISLTSFYDHLLSISGGTRADLNMEAALAIGNELYLFNRGNNRIFVVDWKNLLNSLPDEQAIRQLDIQQYTFELPETEGVQAGFSGACASPDGSRIIFTATLEATENWIADGEILGSYIGVLELSKLREGYVERIALVEDAQGLPLLEKLESISIRSTSPDGELLALAVADNDDGTSKLLELRINPSFIGNTTK